MRTKTIRAGLGTLVAGLFFGLIASSPWSASAQEGAAYRWGLPA